MTKKKQLLLPLILIITALQTASLVLAWDVYGGKWPDNQVTSLYYYDDTSYSEVETSSNDWSTQNIKPNLYSYPYPEYPLVHVFETSGKSWEGCTILSPGESGPTYTACAIYLDADDLDPWSSNKRRSVIGHEFGHCLGLAHPAEATACLMEAYTDLRYDTYGIYTPQQRDVNFVNQIYGSP
jgi:hypothetical protein